MKTFTLAAIAGLSSAHLSDTVMGDFTFNLDSWYDLEKTLMTRKLVSSSVQFTLEADIDSAEYDAGIVQNYENAISSAWTEAKSILDWTLVNSYLWLADADFGDRFTDGLPTAGGGSGRVPATEVYDAPELFGEVDYERIDEEVTPIVSPVPFQFARRING
jgi:hypothetical protein